MTMILSKTWASNLLGESVHTHGKPLVFTFKLEGLQPKSTVRLSFGGQVVRIRKASIDEQGLFVWQPLPYKGATLLLARLETYDDGKAAVYEDEPVAISVSIKDAPVEPKKGFWRTVAEVLKGG